MYTWLSKNTYTYLYNIIYAYVCGSVSDMVAFVEIVEKEMKQKLKAPPELDPYIYIYGEKSKLVKARNVY